MERRESTLRVQLVTALAEQFGRKNSEAGLAMYVKAIADIPLPDLNRAIMRAARECEFMPTPAQLHKFSSSEPKLSSEERALLAWDRVLETIRIHSGYRSVDFDDPVIMATIRTIAGSWDSFCMSLSGEATYWAKKSFLEAYQAHYASGRVTAVAAGPLPGILATDAARDGYEPPAAIRIETNLPPSGIKVLPTPSSPIHISTSTESVGKCLRSPDMEPTTDLIEKVDQPIEDVEGSDEK